jgi:Mn2+/Fe2+ NRAMP family transporter
MSTPSHDPYTLASDAVKPPPATLALALRRIGPGLILAGSIVGTGELIATTNTGAKVGFAFLWLVLVSCFIKVFVQLELGRYAVSSGHTTLMAFRSLPGPGIVLVFWWLAMMLVTQTQMGAMVGGVGHAVHMVMPGVSPWLAELLGGGGTAAGRWLAAHPEMPWAALAAAGTSALLAGGSYRVVERGTTALVVGFTLMTVACVALLPAAGGHLGWSDVLSGLSFQLPEIDGATAAALAMFGITGVGASELVAYPYWCIEKGYARNVGPDDGSASWVARSRGWMRVMFLDAWVSMLVYTVATVAFYLLGAAVLHGHTKAEGLPRNVGGMLDVLAKMYEPVMGSAASRWFIVLGAFAVLYSTLFASTAANCRTLADLLRVTGAAEIRSHADRRRLVSAFCIAFPIIDFGLYVAMGDPRQMVQIGGLTQAVTLPMIGTAALYLRYRRTDRRLLSGRIWDLLLWLSVLGLYVAAGYGVWDGAIKELWR